MLGGISLSVFMKYFKKINDVLLLAEEHIMNLLMIALIASISTQVVCRYLLMYPTPWAEEIARYIYIWLCWIGGAYAIARCSHIEINLADFIAGKLFKDQDKALWVISKIAAALIVLFLIILCVNYSTYFQKLVRSGAFLTATKISVAYTASSVPVGAYLGIVHGLYLLLTPYVKPERALEEGGND